MHEFFLQCENSCDVVLRSWNGVSVNEKDPLDFREVYIYI